MVVNQNYPPAHSKGVATQEIFVIQKITLHIEGV